MRAFLLFIVTLFIFAGCNNSDIEKTKELNRNLLKKQPQTMQKEKLSKTENILKMNYSNKVELQKLKNQNIENLESIKAKNLEKIETIKAQKEQKLKELEVKKAATEALSKEKQLKIEANKSITLAQIASQKEISKAKEQSSFYKLTAIAIAIIALSWLLFYFLNKQSKRSHEAKLKEQELNFQAYMQESKLKHENLGKMLDIIKDENSDKEIKKEMTKLLSHNKKNLLEHKKI
jgi:hypothetical protein